MTELEIIKLSRDLWEELYEKFPIKKFESSYWEQIKYLYLKGACPCCEFYIGCKGCPLIFCIATLDTDWGLWSLHCYTNRSVTYNEAKQAAKNIFEKLDEKYKYLLKQEEKNT
jgi:hypothetical protein